MTFLCVLFLILRANIMLLCCHEEVYVSHRSCAQLQSNKCCASSSGVSTSCVSTSGDSTQLKGKVICGCIFDSRRAKKTAAASRGVTGIWCLYTQFGRPTSCPGDVDLVQTQTHTEISLSIAIKQFF